MDTESSVSDSVPDRDARVPRTALRVSYAAAGMAAAALATFAVVESWLSVQRDQPDGEDPFSVGSLVLWYVAAAVAGLALLVVRVLPDRVRPAGRRTPWWAVLTVVGTAGYAAVLRDGSGWDAQYSDWPPAPLLALGTVGVFVAVAAGGVLPRRRRVVGWAVSVAVLVATWLLFALAAQPHA